MAAGHLQGTGYFALEDEVPFCIGDVGFVVAEHHVMQDFRLQVEHHQLGAALRA
ncbi:hypothetical protein D3C84_1225440 [compost metagenome]